MDDLFRQLEAHLKSIMQKYEHFQKTAMTLQQNQGVLIREKEVLLAKNKVAIAKIENMVSRLKSIENYYE